MSLQLVQQLKQRKKLGWFSFQNQEFLILVSLGSHKESRGLTWICWLNMQRSPQVPKLLEQIQMNSCSIWYVFISFSKNTKNQEIILLYISFHFSLSLLIYCLFLLLDTVVFTEMGQCWHLNPSVDCIVVLAPALLCSGLIPVHLTS